MIASEPLPHFVDDLLSYLYETHPTHATLDGVHTHDDLLEDVSRHGIDSEAHALAGYLRRLDEINRDALTGIERLEHRMLTAHLQARMFELEAVRTWERNPQFYSDLLATSLAGQTLFTHAPAAERARRVLSKLRQTPRLIQAARDNIKDPPGIFVKVGIETMRGALKFIDEDLPRAFADVDDLHLLGDLADAQTEAAHAVGQYVEYLETDLAPKARASFRLGRDKFEQKLRLDEGVTLPIDRLLAIATRELQATQEEFRSLAGKMNGGDAMAAWAKTKAQHPAPGQLVASGRQQLDELATFLERQNIITLPPGEPIAVAPTPDFYRWSFASMWTPGPFESKPTRAYYYLTDVDPSWPAARQDEHLRDYNLPDAVVDLDPRGLSGTLPALSAPEEGRVEGAQVDHVRAGLLHRRMGALLRTDDDRSGLRPPGPEHQARTARRSPDPPGALHRLHQAARGRHVRGAGGPLLP